MRSKKILANTIIGLIEEVIAVFCSFILSHLILSFWGSQYNGLTTSISQFLNCAVLLRAGIGGATRAALYKPLAENNKEQIEAILKSTSIFMRKVGFILAVMIIVFACFFAFIVKNEFELFFTFSLFIIIGSGTFAETFFGITYLILLQADQKLWVTSALSSVCYIFNTALSVVLIVGGASIHIVKFGSAVVYVIKPIILSQYVKRMYQLNTKVIPNNFVLAQRWDAFCHQVATFVMNNTDVMLLTFFTNMSEISVYSIYNLVVSGLKQGVVVLSTGLEAAFGSMIANKENKVLNRNISLMEFVFYSVATIVYTSAALLILSFVNIYTKGITDVNYNRPFFAYILLMAQFFYVIRMPYQSVVQAAGHYRQTRNGAIIEPIINIIISVVAVIQFGLVGVAFGTLLATIFRTIQYSTYMSKHIVFRSMIVPVIKCVVSVVESGMIILIVLIFKLNTPKTYYMWFFNAIIVFLIAVIVVISGAVIFFREDLGEIVSKIKNAIKK